MLSLCSVLDSTFFSVILYSVDIQI